MLAAAAHRNNLEKLYFTPLYTAFILLCVLNDSLMIPMYPHTLYMMAIHWANNRLELINSDGLWMDRLIPFSSCHIYNRRHTSVSPRNCHISTQSDPSTVRNIQQVMLLAMWVVTVVCIYVRICI